MFFAVKMDVRLPADMDPQLKADLLSRERSYSQELQRSGVWVHIWRCGGEIFVTTDKLRVLVRVDLDCAKAHVAAQGHVTSQSVHGLYDVMKRANSLTAGMALELDMTRARIEPDALEELRTCSRSHHLPARVDPLQSDYRLSILTPDNAAPLAAMATQAA